MAVLRSCSLFILMLFVSNIGCNAFVPIPGRSSSPVWNPLNEIWNVDPLAILEENPLSALGGDTRQVSLSRVDWKETPESHIIKIDVPGIGREDIKIEYKDDVLTVSGEIKKEEKKENEQWHRVERVEGKFIRQFRLPDGDMEGVKATLESGVLTVIVPKVPQEKRQPKPIPINVQGNCGETDVKTCKA